MFPAIFGLACGACAPLIVPPGTTDGGNMAKASDSAAARDAGPDRATAASCDVPTELPCPPGCVEQRASIAADSGTCALPIRLYCGAPLTGGQPEEFCAVLADGGLVTIPSLDTELPPSVAFRRCTEAEASAADAWNVPCP